MAPNTIPAAVQTPAPLSEIRALLRGARPAADELIKSIAEAYRDRCEHEHPTRNEDWHCANLAGWMGDRMPVVLSRLLDAEARVAELEAKLAASEEHAAKLAGCLVDRTQELLSAERDAAGGVR